MQINGLAAIVTGGASGLGKATAQMLAAAGARVAIFDLNREVGEEVAKQFDVEFKRFNFAIGKYLIDLKRANAAQLSAFGIPASQIEISPYSTIMHNDDYFSYRLEKGQTGRMLAVIGIKN